MDRSSEDLGGTELQNRISRSAAASNFELSVTASIDRVDASIVSVDSSIASVDASIAFSPFFQRTQSRFSSGRSVGCAYCIAELAVSRSTVLQRTSSSGDV